MKTRSVIALMGAVLLIGLISIGCGSREKELKSQIARDIDVLEKQVKEMAAHNDNLRIMVMDMQMQLELMQEELDKESPRINAAKTSLASLKELNRLGLGDSPAEETLKEGPGNSKIWIFVVILLVAGFFVYRSLSSKSAG